MTREEALQLLQEKIKNEKLRKHCLAVEAILRSLASRFQKSQEMWGLAGLLHDLDVEIVKGDPQRHGLVGAEILEGKGVSKEIPQAVKAHNEALGFPRESLLDKTLYCADPLTGLIVAATLVLPSKKLADLTPESVLRRFKEKAFAKSVNRQTISACSEIGLSLEGFVKIGVQAMQGISEDLGL